MDRLAALPSATFAFVTREHLLEALAKPSTLPSFTEARFSAKRAIRANSDACGIVTLTLRADDRIELLRFGARGGATVIATL